VELLFPVDGLGDEDPDDDDELDEDDDIGLLI